MKEIIVVMWAAEEEENTFLCTTFGSRARAERKIGQLYMNGIPFRYKRIPAPSTLEYILWVREELIEELKKGL
jgi:hypothetical protein